MACPVDRRFSCYARRAMKHTFLLIASLGLLGCEQVDYIDIQPGLVTLKQPTNQVFLEARCMARTGVRATKAKVGWAIKDASIATVDQAGLVKPVKSGRTEAVARYGELEARVPVEVLFTEKIEVQPPTLTLKEGTPAEPVKVTAYDFEGKVLKDRSPTLVSQDRKVAQIVGGGAVLALDPGITTIDVQVDGKHASVAVTVEKDTKAPKK